MFCRSAELNGEDIAHRMRLPRFTAPNMVMKLIHSLYRNLFLLSFFRSLFCSFTLSLIHVFTGPFFHYRGRVTAVLLVHVVYNASYASFFAMELKKSLVNYDIRATCKTTLSPKHYIKRYQQQELTLKNC